MYTLKALLVLAILHFLVLSKINVHRYKLVKQSNHAREYNHISLILSRWLSYWQSFVQLINEFSVELKIISLALILTWITPCLFVSWHASLGGHVSWLYLTILFFMLFSLMKVHFRYFAVFFLLARTRLIASYCWGGT